MRTIKISIAISLLYLISLIPICAQGADYFLGIERYSFINYTDNILQQPDNDSAFKNLFLRFDSLIAYGKGKIKIVHIGGSHIQADAYTHIMRTRLQNLSPDMNGGRGLIFPYRIARTNNPSNFSVSCTGNWWSYKSLQQNHNCKLGLTGIAVLSSDSISQISINPNPSDSTHYVFEVVRVFHEPCSYQLYAISGNTLLPGSYDSINHCTLFEFNEPQDIFHLKIIKDTINTGENFALLGIELIRNSPGVVYNAVGINGAMVSSFLQCELYETHLKAIAPDLIIMSIGTNDGYTRRFDEGKYRNEYGELISRTIKAAPGAAIMLTVPNDSYLFRRYTNSNTGKMKAIILDLAEEYNCAIWDFYSIMGGLNSCQAWYDLKLMKYDRIHFTRKGYELKGDLLFSAFLKAWESQLPGFKSGAPVSGNNNNY